MLIQDQNSFELIQIYRTLKVPRTSCIKDEHLSIFLLKNCKFESSIHLLSLILGFRTDLGAEYGVIKQHKLHTVLLA